MTMAVALMKADLDQVFNEVEEAQEDLYAKRGAVQAAEEQAEEAKGLTAAAQRDLKNAVARLRVLQLAQAEAAKDPEYAQLVHQLDDVSAEYAEAQEQATVVGQAKEALAGYNTALAQWVTEAKQATAAFSGSADAIAGLPVAANAETDRRNAADAVRNRGTELDSKLDQLGNLPQNQQLSDAVQQLDQLAPSPAELEALEQEKTELENRCQAARSRLEKVPDQDDVDRAQVAQEAARTAVDEAPEVERDRQAKLRLARQELAAAEDRQAAAIVAKDQAERRLIEGIELIGPGTDGFLIAEAGLRYGHLPEGYSLEWTVDGILVSSYTGMNPIRINTKGLAAGRYAIAVHLHPDPAPLAIANN